MNSMTDKEKLEKIKALADKMYSRMAYLTSDTRPIRQAMDEYHQFIINEYHKEEPVSEKECMYSKDNYTDEDRKVLCEDCKEKCAYTIAGVISTNAQFKKESVSEDLEEAAQEYTEKGSKCQEELDAFKAGANWQKQQMMKETVSGHVGQTINGMLRALSDETFGDMGFTAGDKVKLIILKDG